MKYTSVFFPVLVLLLSTYACSDNSTHHDHAHMTESGDSVSMTDHSHHAHGAASLGSPELDTLNRQVLVIHDSAMARMGELAALQEKAHQQSVTLKPTDTQRKKELTALLNELNTADEAMLQWMQQFDGQLKTKADSAKVVYLQTERIKIDLVYQQILQAIHHAHSVLQDVQPN